MQKIPTWSASSLDAFITCPHKYYRLRVARDVKDFPPSDALLLGRKLHKDFENAVNYGDPLPESCKHWQSLVDKLKTAPGERLVEYEFCVNENFQPCTRKEAWSRGLADLVIKCGKTALIIDYKTGKRKPSDQLALYAAYAFATWPEIQTVHTNFVWLKDRKMDKDVYTREQVPELWGKFLPLVARMKHAFESDVWDTRPSGLCRQWCPVKDCKFCGV